MSVIMGTEITTSITEKLFGIFSPNFHQQGLKVINHLMLIAKMCISKYRYGEHENLLQIFKFELALRKCTGNETP